MKIAVIINPKAGSIKSFPALLKKIARLAPDRRYTTRKRGNAKLFAARAISEGCNYIIAAGGDGTLNEVVNGIGRSSRIVRLGLLPLGTGNDFARCLGLPSSVDENIEILRAGKTRAIDMVKVTSDRVRYFLNVSAGGFSGIVDEKLTSRMKKTWGPLVYLRSAAAAFSDLHSYRTRVRFGPKAAISYELYNIIVANGRYIAGGWPIAPKANPADGFLDVILIKKAPAATLAFLGAKMMVGKHLDSDAVVFRRVRSISINSKPGMWFNVDGELVGNQPARFEVIPRALQFVVGKKKMNPKIVDAKKLSEVAREMKARGQKLVFTNGCFDLLHAGHVRYLAAARALGDALAVGINGDESVRSLKGAGRPINREADRAEVMAALGPVDYVTIFPEVRTANLLRLVRPQIYAKGGDYTPETLNAEEKSVLDDIGAEIRIVPFEPGYSTTTLINRLGPGKQ